MSHLYIHCGLPKTGTSSLQHFLANERHELKTLGFDYPVLGTNKRGTAHHNLARELQDDPEFLPERGSTQDFLNYLKEPRFDNIVLSTEGFTHCLQKKRERFFAFLHAVSLIQSPFVLIFTFTHFSKIAESTYLYQLTRGLLGSGNGKPPSPALFGSHLRKLFINLDALHNNFPQARFEALDNERYGGNSITGIRALLGIPSTAALKQEGRLNEKLGLKKTAFMYRIQYLPDGSPRRRWKPQTVAKIRSYLRKFPELPNEIHNYRVMPHSDAVLIQQIAKKRLPSFLSKSLELATETSIPYYDNFDLTDPILPEPEFLQLLESLPNKLSNDIRAVS